MEMKFPYVNGYIFETRKGMLSCDVANIEPLSIDPRVEPTLLYLRPTTGYVDTNKLSTACDFVKQDRREYYDRTHFQTILFQITHLIVEDLLTSSPAATDTRGRVMRLQSRHVLFPQVFAFVRAYVSTRVRFNGVDPRELGLQRYVQLVVERVRTAIVPDTSAGEPPLLPILDRYRPYGSTATVDFTTTRPVCSAEKSHINLVAQHSDWEGQTAKILDASPAVRFHARNEQLGLAIPYEYLEVDHDYEPDFLVRLTNEVTLLLEIKGYEVFNPERTAAKHNAARRWVLAVNNLKDFGNWGFLVCRDLADLPRMLQQVADIKSDAQQEAPRTA
jgi:type III restriction enzyme